MSGFAPPAIYNLPPFFTLQPVAATRERQAALWCDVVVSFCRANKLYEISNDLAVWHHPTLKLHLPREAIQIVVDALLASGRAVREKGVAANHAVYVLWKPMDEWANEFKQWALRAALDNTVCTIEELASGGEYVHPPPFAPCPPGFAECVFEALEKRGECELMRDDDGTVEGLRFTYVK